MYEIIELSVITSTIFPILRLHPPIFFPCLILSQWWWYAAEIYDKHPFLDASMHLYIRVCPSVGPSVHLAVFFYAEFVPKWLSNKGKVNEWIVGYPGHLYMRVCRSVSLSLCLWLSVASVLPLRAFFRTAEIKWRRHRITGSQDLDPWPQTCCKQPTNSLQYTCKQSATSKLQSDLANPPLRFFLRPSLQTRLCSNELVFENLKGGMLLCQALTSKRTKLLSSTRSRFEED